MRNCLWLVLLLGACGGDDDPCGEPDYGGIATDEGWRAMVDAEAMVMAGHAQAPVFTAPAPGTVMPATGAAPFLSWTSPIARKPHLPPITSDIYWVRISAPGAECPVTLLTTELEWQLAERHWSALKAAPGEMSVSIISAYLIENRVDEGPFAPATPLTFRVQ